MELFTTESNGEVILWGGMDGRLGRKECGQLLFLLESISLPPGIKVVLDFSDATHIDFRAVPLLIQMGRKIERRSGAFMIAGVTEYLRFIMELGSALDGREFIEEHVWAESVPKSNMSRRRRSFQLDEFGALASSIAPGRPCLN
jgi:ABC-type transporter Mla MlaB component